MLRKYLLTIFVISALVLAGCGNSDDEEEKDTTDDEEEVIDEVDEEETDGNGNEDENGIEEDDSSLDEEEEDETASSSNNAGNEDLPDLTLQMLKVDEEDGVTFENNAVYAELVEVIAADPKAGIPNDFAVYAHDLVFNEDGSTSALFIGVNRLDVPIKNLYFELTLGNIDGDYIFLEEPILLDEEFAGIIEPHSAIPFTMLVTPEQEEIFMGLTESNILIELNNADVEFVN